jgi:hypothetical protein
MVRGLFIPLFSLLISPFLTSSANPYIPTSEHQLDPAFMTLYDAKAMARLRLSKEYARMLAERAMELANLCLVGMVFVQFTPEGQGKLAAVLMGITAFWVLHIFAYLVLRIGGEER